LALGEFTPALNQKNMKIPKLILDYSKLNDAQLNLRAQNVLEALTDNVNFTSTIPTLIVFGALEETYSAALTKAATGDRQQIALKNEAKLALVLAMRQLSLDISTQANGNKAKLLSSGFDMASPGDHSGPLENPIDFTLNDGSNAGEMVFSCKGVKNALSYNFQYTDELPTDTTQWKTQPNSGRQYTFRGLRSGIRLYGRITAVGRKGQQADSDILSRLVQ
jgi:hypothetical protein